MPHASVSLSKLVVRLEEINGRLVPRLDIGELEISIGGSDSRQPDDDPHSGGGAPSGGGSGGLSPRPKPTPVPVPVGPRESEEKHALLKEAGSLLLVGAAAAAYLIVPAGGVTPIVPVVVGFAGAAGFGAAAGLGMVALGSVFGGAAVVAGGAYYLYKKSTEPKVAAKELPPELKCPMCRCRWDRVLVACGHAVCATCIVNTPLDEGRMHCPFCRTVVTPVKVVV
eukprot:m51a1_g4403 hypothetical protein (225) ;mRNA; f:421125-422369